jgi:hypothetical protein
MRVWPLALSAALVLMAWSSVPAAQEPPSLDVLLARAGRYAEDFTDHFSSVVAEEDYVQDSTTSRVGPNGTGDGSHGRASHRVLRSDFLLVQLPNSTTWMPFRDVFEVDGKAVHDRDERLEKLFLQPTSKSVEKANAIARESARYNLGNMTRTVNNPVFALAFMQLDYQTHFAFDLEKADPDVGSAVWIVGYRETARPTIVRAAYDRDMPAHGRVWIDALTGRILRTELALDDANVVARVATSFRFDDAFGIAVPEEMTEYYLVGTALERQQELRGIATYGRFRRFAVDADQSVDLPKGR